MAGNFCERRSRHEELKRFEGFGFESDFTTHEDLLVSVDGICVIVQIAAMVDHGLNIGRAGGAEGDSLTHLVVLVRHVLAKSDTVLDRLPIDLVQGTSCWQRGFTIEGRVVSLLVILSIADTAGDGVGAGCGV